jgi:signal transduction histidine kinase
MSYQPVRLDALLRDVVTRSAANDESFDIRLQLKTPELRCQADPTRLAQVLDNLISNARKYAPSSPVVLSLEAVDGTAVITVSDSGQGIAQEHLEHLFKRFYRVSETSTGTRGTGLGLYICRQIVEAHSGKITVESTVGKGTTFQITLPCEP